jgi:hypothetical protein
VGSGNGEDRMRDGVSLFAGDGHVIRMRLGCRRATAKRQGASVCAIAPDALIQRASGTCADACPAAE